MFFFPLQIVTVCVFPRATMDDTCAICLEDSPALDRQLTCGHSFHAACIDKCFYHARGVQQCPYCRARVGGGCEVCVDLYESVYHHRGCFTRLLRSVAPLGDDDFEHTYDVLRAILATDRDDLLVRVLDDDRHDHELDSDLYSVAARAGAVRCIGELCRRFPDACRDEWIDMMQAALLRRHMDVVHVLLQHKGGVNLSADACGIDGLWSAACCDAAAAELLCREIGPMPLLDEDMVLSTFGDPFGARTLALAPGVRPQEAYAVMTALLCHMRFDLLRVLVDRGLAMDGALTAAVDFAMPASSIAALVALGANDIERALYMACDTARPPALLAALLRVTPRSSFDDLFRLCVSRNNPGALECLLAEGAVWMHEVCVDADDALNILHDAWPTPPIVAAMRRMPQWPRWCTTAEFSTAFPPSDALRALVSAFLKPPLEFDEFLNKCPMHFFLYTPPVSAAAAVGEHWSGNPPTAIEAAVLSLFFDARVHGADRLWQYAVDLGDNVVMAYLVYRQLQPRACAPHVFASIHKGIAHCFYAALDDLTANELLRARMSMSDMVHMANIYLPEHQRPLFAQGDAGRRPLEELLADADALAEHIHFLVAWGAEVSAPLLERVARAHVEPTIIAALFTCGASARGVDVVRLIFDLDGELDDDQRDDLVITIRTYVRHGAAALTLDALIDLPIDDGGYYARRFDLQPASEHERQRLVARATELRRHSMFEYVSGEDWMAV
jgi:hypothetical protein